MLDLAEVAAEVRRLSELIDQALEALRRYGRDSATSERDYRKLKSDAWVTTPHERDGKKLIAAEREAIVNAETADIRYARDLAVDLRQAALESVRSRRAQLSALQSLLGAERAEIELARTAPREHSY